MQCNIQSLAAAMEPARLIIALDIDAFYAQAEMLADPTLPRDTPLGVQQKHIIVTCNYPARARGVKKLQTIKDAVAACPDLVIRDGSDIQPYRRASSRVWEVLARAVGVWDRIWTEAGISISNQSVSGHAVSSDVDSSNGGDLGSGAHGRPLDSAAVAALPTKLERLGLDEFFFDVTALIDQHLEQLEVESSNQPGPSTVWFPLPPFRDPKDPSIISNGFYYGPFLTPKDTEIVGAPDHGPPDARLALTAHLALHLRTLLKRCTGFTTSAGISHNKVLAKLASDVKKPDGQSVLPESATRDFVSSVQVGRLQGFGHRMKRDLEEWLEGRTVEENGNRGDRQSSRQKSRLVGVEVDIDELDFLDNNDDEEATFQYAQNDVDTPEEEPSLEVQPPLTPASLLPLLTTPNPTPSLSALLAKHPTLIPLLHGHDMNPVKLTLLPTQISIEDSFRCTGHPDLLRRLGKIIGWLIERIEEEEMVAGKWRRFPKILKLTVRRRSMDYSAAQSRQIAVPFALLDTSMSVEQRISRTRKHLEPLLRSLLLSHYVGGTSEPERIEAASTDVCVLNLCVSGFRKEWVDGAGDIGKFLVPKETAAGVVAGPTLAVAEEHPPPQPPGSSKRPFFATRTDPEPSSGVLAKLGIDPEVFAELPEDMRREILRSGTPQDRIASSTNASGPARKKAGGPLDRFFK